ncbi:hypothetical protein Pan181_19120 [Aeoliella mucimassa]|uniref:Uncharacterized protein n=1 Tax=Aeoliella mucimassa TaxID=2527972 RepID=A0A518ALZ5_9BACT|nr:hypothetical protein Pan181_19120 [Aeoliella mucimassa]
MECKLPLRSTRSGGVSPDRPQIAAGCHHRSGQRADRKRTCRDDRNVTGGSHEGWSGWRGLPHSGGPFQLAADDFAHALGELLGGADQDVHTDLAELAGGLPIVFGPGVVS